MTWEVDMLTGAGSSSALKSALKKAIDQDEIVSLAVLDVDHFHDVNVEFGQEAGDQVLRSVVGLMQEIAPTEVYRLSGDEFALLLPGLSVERAFLRMEELRARAEKACGSCLPDQRPVTVTIGVAQYPRDAKDAGGVLKAAEAGLYSAKEGGRNQVGLTPNEEMVMKSCYYPSAALRKLKVLAERLGKKESVLLREALNDLLRKYDQLRGAQ